MSTTAKTQASDMKALLGPERDTGLRCRIVFLVGASIVVFSSWAMSIIVVPGRAYGGNVRLLAGLGAPEECIWQKYRPLVHPSALYESMGYAKKIEKLLYVKVHKTGSSTITFALRQYGLRRNLTSISDAVETEEGLEAAMADQNISSLDILAGHFRYSTRAVRKVLGRRPFRLGSVRNPKERLLSGFWYGVDRAQSGEDQAGLFVCSDMVDDFRNWAKNCNRLSSQTRYMSPEDWPERSRANGPLVFRHYDHMMVSELMTESLLTLAPKLGMTLMDIVTPARKATAKTNHSDWLSPEEKIELNLLIDERVQKNAEAQRDERVHTLAQEKIMEEFVRLPELLRQVRDDYAALRLDLVDSCGPNVAIHCKDNWIRKRVLCIPTIPGTTIVPLPK